MKYVGTNFLHYYSIRNFTGVPVPGYAYKRLHDPTKFLEYAIFRLFKKIPLSIHNIFLDFPSHPVDLFHFFNTTYVGRKPWVLTIENISPHFGKTTGWQVNAGLKRMAEKNCMAILALSQNSFNRQSFFLQDHPQVSSAILNKMSVLHPSQKLFRGDMTEKKLDMNNVRFIFVGRFFFHKGGLEMVKAMSRLLAEGYNFAATIVGSFQRTNWLDSHVTATHEKEAMDIIAKHSRHIIYKTEIPNNEVLELIRLSDVGLLPSYGESYGYSVLELQAFGCPVITTNVWAFEEINNNEKGWLIEVPRVNDHGGFEADLHSKEKLGDFSRQLEEGLYLTMKSILENPVAILKKGELCIKDIREKHSPINAGMRLKEVYDQAAAYCSVT